MIGGWMKSDTAKLAHYFDASGHSACHMWTQTMLDKPVTTGPYCPVCSAVAIREGR